MLKIKQAIIVEGKYDKIKLENIVDGVIICTNGFSIFKSKEKRKLIKMYAEKCGLIILTDSDRAGFLIRSHLKSFIPIEQITNVYLPDIFGKEKRKTQLSAEGKLGVEGIEDRIIIDALERAGCLNAEPRAYEKKLTSANLFDFGLSGGKDSSARRKALLNMLNLPENLSAKGLIDALNTFYNFEEAYRICQNFSSRMLVQ